jgi:hypothetical protein
MSLTAVLYWDSLDAEGDMSCPFHPCRSYRWGASTTLVYCAMVTTTSRSLSRINAGRLRRVATMIRKRRRMQPCANRHGDCTLPYARAVTETDERAMGYGCLSMCCSKCPFLGISSRPCWASEMIMHATLSVVPSETTSARRQWPHAFELNAMQELRHCSSPGKDDGDDPVSLTLTLCQWFSYPSRVVTLRLFAKDRSTTSGFRSLVSTFPCRVSNAKVELNGPVANINELAPRFGTETIFH